MVQTFIFSRLLIRICLISTLKIKFNDYFGRKFGNLSTGKMLQTAGAYYMEKPLIRQSYPTVDKCSF
jgi:hypothetical protein